MSRPPTPSTPANRPPQPAVPDDAGKKGNDEVPDEDIEPADSTADDPRPDDGPVTAARPLRRLSEFDAARPDLPGEHLVVLGLGAWLMLRGMRGTTPLRRMLWTLAGTTLVGRAASGTGGIARVARLVRRLG
ncbi:hypothetical protein [Achromobacter xylosoxidans]|uniref:hypothetical protein n=1 Tax=Alcaligenes xylosoxydans xylosoxydans TaxID=85698 RepID=UPI000A8EAB7F|nr:hypothetical protein [Achromobacter xylosoxidans]